MKVKYFVFGLLFFFGYIFLTDNEDENSSMVYSQPPTIEDRKVSSIELYDIGELFDTDTKLSDLAEPDHYTIVEIYSIHCSTCAKIDKRFKKFINKRKDVVIKKVKTFSGSIQFPTSDGLTMNEWRQRQDEIRDTYQFYGTPHIEIYGPYGNVIAADNNRNKTGLNFLFSWLDDSLK
jgi:hypothetical protein